MRLFTYIEKKDSAYTNRTTLPETNGPAKEHTNEHHHAYSHPGFDSGQAPAAHVHKDAAATDGH